jgi:hypothetical protein
MTAAARRPASPYARRLARERGLSLTAVTGSGPGGRIVAADIASFGTAPAIAAGTAPLPAAATVSAFAVTVGLGAVQKLLADLGGAALPVNVDDLLLRAAALALEAVPAAPGGAAPVVAWESGGGADRRLTKIANAHLGLVSALHGRLAAGLAAPAETDAGGAALSVRRIVQSGVRATALPLLGGCAMRLAVAADDSTAAAECLLAFDAGRIGEDDAAAFLARFRDGLEAPLRLLA